MNMGGEKKEKEERKKILPGQLKVENGFYVSVRTHSATHSYVLHILYVECLCIHTHTETQTQLITNQKVL